MCEPTGIPRGAASVDRSSVRPASWPSLVIETAIHTHDPELIAAILEAEARYDVENYDDNPWVDEHGNELPREDPEEGLAALAWPARVATRVRWGGAGVVNGRPSPPELLERPGALLTRGDLRRPRPRRRTMVDAVFRELAVVVFPGSRRPAVKREDYLELVERCTYRDDRVRPT